MNTSTAILAGSFLIAAAITVASVSARNDQIQSIGGEAGSIWQVRSDGHQRICVFDLPNGIRCSTWSEGGTLNVGRNKDATRPE